MAWPSENPTSSDWSWRRKIKAYPHLETRISVWLRPSREPQTCHATKRNCLTKRSHPHRIAPSNVLSARGNSIRTKTTSPSSAWASGVTAPVCSMRCVRPRLPTTRIIPASRTASPGQEHLPVGCRSCSLTSSGRQGRFVGVSTSRGANGRYELQLTESHLNCFFFLDTKHASNAEKARELISPCRSSG